MSYQHTLPNPLFERMFFCRGANVALSLKGMAAGANFENNANAALFLDSQSRTDRD
jgi:hypothetical protein